MDFPAVSVRGIWVRSPVRELRSYMPRGMVFLKKKKSLLWGTHERSQEFQIRKWFWIPRTGLLHPFGRLWEVGESLPQVGENSRGEGGVPKGSAVCREVKNRSVGARAAELS